MWPSGADIRPDFNWEKQPAGEWVIVPWSDEFDDPIPLPDGRKLATLSDARAYILELKKAEQDSPEWQTAISVLLMAAEGRGPIMHARIGILRALASGGHHGAGYAALLRNH